MQIFCGNSYMGLLPVESEFWKFESKFMNWLYTRLTLNPAVIKKQNSSLLELISSDQTYRPTRPFFIGQSQRIHPLPTVSSYKVAF